MKTTIKVKEIREVETSQKDTVQCAEGRLLIVNLKDTWLLQAHKVIQMGGHPIIISETDKIEEGNWVYHSEWNMIGKVIKKLETNKYSTYYKVDYGNVEFENGQRSAGIKLRKILALPKHFTTKQLQVIIEGKMQDGDKVMVECELKWMEHPEGKGVGKYSFIVIKQPITLHKAEGSWDDIFNNSVFLGIKGKILEFLKENYHPPKLIEFDMVEINNSMKTPEHINDLLDKDEKYNKLKERYDECVKALGGLIRQIKYPQASLTNRDGTMIRKPDFNKAEQLIIKNN